MERTKQQLLTILGQTISEGLHLTDRKRHSYYILEDEKAADCQYWLSKIIATLEGFLPITSYHFEQAVRLANRSHRQGGYLKADLDALIGHLRFLRDAVDNDLLHSIEKELSAEGFGNFLIHAKDYLAVGKKNEASVIAAAVLEDSVKRLGRDNGIENLSKLEQVINALKSKNVINPNDAKRLKHLVGIRNSALHADWSQFDQGHVEDLIKGAERVLEVLIQASFRSSEDAIVAEEGL